MFFAANQTGRFHGWGFNVFSVAVGALEVIGVQTVLCDCYSPLMPLTRPEHFLHIL